MVLARSILNERGQVSIEFILIVTIALIYINAAVWPSIDISSKTAIDVKGVADTKVSAMKIANAVNEAATSSGDMKKTINVFLPTGGMILLQEGSFEIQYESAVNYLEGFNPMELIDDVGCEENTDNDGNPFFRCKSNIKILSSAGTSLNLNPSPFDIKGSLFRPLVIEKNGVDILVYWE